MGYFTYAVTPIGAQRRYHDRQDVKLAGGGLLKQAWRQYCGAAQGQWHVAKSQLLQASGLDASRSIVIDTSPKRNVVCLFELKHVLGWTAHGEDWNYTPVCFLMEELFSDEDVGKEFDGFKLDFLDGECSRISVRTILYLGDGWNWGGNSRTTAALLWPETWEFFKTWKP